MHITDANGKTWVVLARTWTGAGWKIIPERVMKNNYWWLINYVRYSIGMGIKHDFNMDNTVSMVFSPVGINVFPPEDPIPI